MLLCRPLLLLVELLVLGSRCGGYYQIAVRRGVQERTGRGGGAACSFGIALVEIAADSGQVPHEAILAGDRGGKPCCVPPMQVAFSLEE